MYRTDRIYTHPGGAFVSTDGRTRFDYPSVVAARTAHDLGVVEHATAAEAAGDITVRRRGLPLLHHRLTPRIDSLTDPPLEKTMPLYLTDRIYVDEKNEQCFVSPDGIGRYFYDTVTEAEVQHGLTILRFASAAELEDHYSDCTGRCYNDGDKRESGLYDIDAHLHDNTGDPNDCYDDEDYDDTAA